MRYPVLNKRLSTVASWVRAGSVLADIGTDHGYLAANLVGRGVCPRAYACDVGSLPLARARETVTHYGLSDKISLVLSDGLTGLAPHSAQDIVIAGMGGELIARILNAAPWVQDESVRLILQPMTRQEDLRRYLYQNGFEIVAERGVCEGRHSYTVMCVHYTGRRILQPDALMISLGGLGSNPDEETKEYIRRLLRKEHRKAEGILASSLEHREALAKQTQDFIKEIERATGVALEE